MKLFMIPFLVYLGLNMIENLIHYNIGKYTDQTTRMDLPTMMDWVKIIVVMISFAFLQGLFTCILDKEC